MMSSFGGRRGTVAGREVSSPDGVAAGEVVVLDRETKSVPPLLIGCETFFRKSDGEPA